MTAPAPTPHVSPAAAFAAEWERIELLGHILAQQRQGGKIAEQALARLRLLQTRVDEARGTPGYALAAQFTGIEWDVLLCSVAPEAEPRLGWTYQQLQGGNSPYPTAALLQELLAMDATEAGELHAALSAGGALRRRGLIRVDDGDLYRPIRPMPGLAARLLGRTVPAEPPPGATLVDISAGRQDLVLTGACRAMVDEFLLWIRHRGTVEGLWSGEATGGPVALFTGPSGTGKTFTAAALANELGWPLYRIDLSQVVNKYIGETEKNLARIFEAAEGQDAILFFDEADALFGKRSKVQDAHDRYANLAIAYLLQRIEAHHGPCILATNLRENLDTAFARRFQMVIEFPRPDAALRADLWRRLLPPRAPCGNDVDPAFLGRAVNLTGGQIRNAALHAAYLAAGAAAEISLPRIALAVWRELCKEDREVSRTDLGELGRYIRE
ncbi:MAG: ATP-binding protein, partial [Candidatus Solibacter sp.]|nr:ATP-binding protein [Candidatus Solibacter sp.]